MARGSKATYTSKQKCQAKHIEKGYEERGVSKEESKKRAWATVNKISGGGKKSGSGRGKKTNSSPSKKGGKIGGKVAAKTLKTKSSSKHGTRSNRSTTGSRSTRRSTTKKAA